MVSYQYQRAIIKPLYLQRHMHIIQTHWAAHAAELRHIRELVFIIEQAVPVALEWDGLDETAIHLLLFVENKAVACARILNFNQIGRMAVLANYRRLGLGLELLNKAIDICKIKGATSVILSAQVYAIPFYEKAGFVVNSDVYDDAGIAHRDMVLNTVA